MNATNEKLINETVASDLDRAGVLKVTLSSATKELFFVASRIPVLRRMMGIVQNLDDSIGFLKIERPWLVVLKTELSFDPDTFARPLDVKSSGERHAMLFLLNVWNPGYAKSKGWDFRLFDAVGTLDSDNLEGICEWMQRPIWP